MTENKRVVVPLTFSADDWHLMQECVRAVAQNLHLEMDVDDRAYVRKRCAEVLLKIDDFVVETKYLLTEENDGSGTERMDRDSPGFDLHRAVFGNKRKT